MKRNHRSFWLKAAICCAGYGIMSDVVIIPLVTTLFGENGAYPNTSLFLQNFIISGNTVIALFTISLASFLMKYISKRKLLIMGTILFFVAGVGCALVNDMVSLAILRALDTASDGLLSVVTAAMIIELWQSERDQGTMFGWYNAMSSVFASVIVILAGYAALVSWRLAFAVNAVSIISVILVIIFVPETGIVKQKEIGDTSEDERKKTLVFKPFSFTLTMGGMFVFTTIMMVFVYMMDFYVLEKGFGNSIATGYLTSAATLIGIVSCLIATPVLEKIKNKSFYVALFFGVTAVANIIYGISNNFFVVVVVTVLAAFFTSWPVVYYNVYIGQMIPKKQRGLCISIYMGLLYLTGFVAPYIPVFTGRITGDATIATTCYFGGIILAIITIIYLIRAYALKDNPETL